MDVKLVDKPQELEVPESMLYMVYLTLFVDTLASSISTPVMPFYAQSFGVPVAWIGGLYAAYSFSATVFAPMLSSMGDKWGRKSVLVMCLFGSGVANVIQGVALYCGHFGFWVFLFGRGFSGVWASVNATCNVYVTDVAGEGIRDKYLSTLSMIPLFAILLGPGLGGGLAQCFGNNVPVLLDGCITLASGVYVYANLVETPAFQRHKLSTSVAGQGLSATRGAPASHPAKVSRAIHLIGLASLMISIASQANLSMYALFFQSIFNATVGFIGFLCMGAAVVMVFSNALLVPQFRKVGGAMQTSFIGGAIGSIGFFGLSQVSKFTPCVAMVFLGNAGSAIQMSQQSAIVAPFTSVGNRAVVFSLVQTYQNLGRIIGPVIATNVATGGIPGVVEGFMGLPFLLSSFLMLAASLVMLACQRFDPKQDHDQGRSPVARGATTFGDAWEDEKGTKEDAEALGRFVSQLLTQRHYKWVSEREDVERLLEQVLPVLDVSHRESYSESLRSANRLDVIGTGV